MATFGEFRLLGFLLWHGRPGKSILITATGPDAPRRGRHMHLGRQLHSFEAFFGETAAFNRHN